MTVGKAVGFIVVGVLAIVAGLTKGQFYAAGRFRVSDRPISRWQGQTLFLLVGAMLIVVGVSHLIIDLWVPK